MKTNLNFGEATRLRTSPVSLRDLYTAGELVEVKGTIGASERGVFEDIVGEELTHMMFVAEFHSSYSTCTTFITRCGEAYFDTPKIEVLRAVSPTSSSRARPCVRELHRRCRGSQGLPVA